MQRARDIGRFRIIDRAAHPFANHSSVMEEQGCIHQGDAEARRRVTCAGVLALKGNGADSWGLTEAM
jgi:hypothetical protein